MLNPLKDDEIMDLLSDIVAAEAMPLPSFAKHEWVRTCQLNKRCQSPPPDWIWILSKLIDAILPIIIEYLKKRYGTKWPARLANCIAAGVLPWRDSA